MDVMNKMQMFCDFLLLSLQYLKTMILYRNRRRRSRRWWVRPHICEMIREQHGAYQKLFKYFKINNHDQFFELTRMSVQQFNVLHNLVKPRLRKKSNRKNLYRQNFVWLSH